MTLAVELPSTVPSLGRFPLMGRRIDENEINGLRGAEIRCKIGPLSAHLRRSRSTAIDPERSFCAVQSGSGGGTMTTHVDCIYEVRAAEIYLDV